MRHLVAASALVLLAASTALAQIEQEPEKLFYRVNCGAELGSIGGYSQDYLDGFRRHQWYSDQRLGIGEDWTIWGDYTDRNGVTWKADQRLEEGKDWGYIGGGGTWKRDVKLRIPGPSPELYRYERSNPEAYEFRLPEGVYAVRLHFCEGFDSFWAPGFRAFNVKVQGEQVLHNFDPFKEAGGFASPAVVEVSGQRVADGKLRIEFERGDTESLGGPKINAIEIFRTGPAEAKVAKVLPVGDVEPRPCPGCEDIAADGKPVKMLFIGNSFTIFWALPETIAAMVNSGQSELHVIPERCVRGGKGISWHYHNTDVLERIETGDFDYVVLQELGKDRSKILDYPQRYLEVIRKTRAKTLIYSTWVSGWGAPSGQDHLTDLYIDAGNALGDDVSVVPVGAAWQAARQARPDLMLYNVEDGFHPGIYGSYLSACTFYAALTGKSPVGLACHATQVGHVPIDDEVAEFLQRIAWETVQKYKARCKLKLE